MTQPQRAPQHLPQSGQHLAQAQQGQGGTTFLLLIGLTFFVGAGLSALFFFGESLNLPESLPTYSYGEQENANLSGADTGEKTETDTPGTVAVQTGPSLEFRITKTGVLFAGTVPDQATFKELQTVGEETYGEFHINEVLVDPNVGATPWFETAPELAALLRNASDTSIDISSNGITYTGSAATDNEAEAFAETLATVSGLTVNSDAVTITGQAPPEVAVVSSKGDLALEGSLPSEKVREYIVDSAAAIAGEEAVTDSSTADSNTDWSYWMVTMPQTMKTLSLYNSYEINNIGHAVSYTARGNVSFNQETIEFDPETTATLEQGVELALEQPNLSVSIKVPADSEGSEEAEAGLSQRRAEAIAEYLKSEGIPEENLTTTDNDMDSGNGMDSGMAEGSTKDSQVEFVFSDEP